MKSITIHFSPTTCSLVAPVDSFVDRTLYTELSYQPDGYFYSPRFQSNMWDGFYHLYNKNKHSFRVGFLERVCGILNQLGYDVVIENFPLSEGFVQRSSTYTLRGYQKDAIEDLVKYRFGILQAPVRSGKTNIVVAIVDSERKFPGVFFCRSKDLAYQTVERFKVFLPDVKVGMVCDGVVDIQDFTIITIQSAYSAFGKKLGEKVDYKEAEIADKKSVMKVVKQAQMVFYDETHHSQSLTSRFILNKCDNALLRIGLSATPFSGKPEDMRTEESVGSIIHKIGFSDLIREGFLLRPFIYVYHLPKISFEKTPYKTVYKEAVTENLHLLQLIGKLAKSLMDSGKSVVIQTEYVSHAKNIIDHIPGSVLLYGKHGAMYRQEIIEKLKTKSILCVVSTLFEEGIDVPSLDFTINAAGGLSNISTLQRMRSITSRPQHYPEVRVKHPLLIF